MSPDVRSPAARRLCAPTVAPLATLAVASILLLGGCAGGPWRPVSAERSEVAIADDFPRSRVVAADFVEAMVRLPELHPSRTTLRTARPPSRFGEILVASLQDAGYDLRLGAAGDPQTLDYEIRPEGAEGSGAETYTFFLTAGSVRMKRTYRVDGDGIAPLSAMRLHGADASALAAPPATPRYPLPAVSPVPVRSSGARADVPAVRAPRPLVPLTRAGDAGGAAVGAVERPAVPTRPASTPSEGTPGVRRNMYELQRSNYAELLAGYDTVRREVMVFPNDSLHMGRDNKRLARELAAAFDPERDVVSVIGCSHGRTALENGNERLANGRAARVKEELVLAGLDAAHVLDEGCWAGRHFEKMPNRGVVVTLKRRAAG